MNSFLFTRVAFWIAVGVPTSVAAALFFLYTQGGSINFLSTFGFLMAFGIIVDDTIVVAEQAFSEYQKGKHPLEAVKVAANMMVAPVLASSVTTIAAFMPLLVMQGLFGKILKDIPLVVMVVIAASLIECFLILPYHIKVALSKINPRHQGLRWSWNQRISHFQYNIFRRFVNHAVDYAWVTIFAGVSLIMIPFMLLGSGRIKFDFFPNLPSDILFLDADFYPGTPAKTIKQFLAEANRSLAQQDRVLNSDGQSMVQVPIQMLYYTSPDGGALAIGNDYSDAHAAMLIGVSSPDSRSVTNEMFMQSVRDDLLKKAPADMLNISLGQPAAGPPGADLRLLIIGNDIHTIKQAAEATKLKLSGINGVVNIKDSLPYGKAEYVLTLTQKAKALGLTKSQLSAQLSASLYGSEVQKHTAFSEIIKVNVRIEDQDQKNANILENLPIIIGQQTIPLGELAQATLSHSFTRYTQYNGKQYAEVSADMQKGVANLQDVLKVVNDQVIPDISQRFDVRFSDEEQSRYETEALNELQYGAILGLLMIYLVLSWVSRSYVWPLVVMVVIPFGLAGALLGHYWLGFPLTLLSIFGLFGLTGIVVNNAIIWLHRYQALLAEGVSEQEAIVDASCQRLRAVFLTTVTTIVGLVPLLLETSLQARFLQPMVISISFGLAMATLLILFVLPALMSILSRGRNKSIRSDG